MKVNKQRKAKKQNSIMNKIVKFDDFLNEELTAGQKKLPEGLQKAILAKQAKSPKKEEDSEEVGDTTKCNCEKDKSLCGNNCKNESPKTKKSEKKEKKEKSEKKEKKTKKSKKSKITTFTNFTP